MDDELIFDLEERLCPYDADEHRLLAWLRRTRVSRPLREFRRQS